MTAYLVRQIAYRAGQLVALLLGVSTLLFLVLRLATNPAVALAGENAGPADLARVTAYYRLDRPLWEQYARFVGEAARLRFGDSAVHRTDALSLVVARLPATLALDLTAMALTITLAVAVGAWLGFRPERAERRAALIVVLASQGCPPS